MASKIITLERLNKVSQSVKTYVNGLVSGVAKTSAEAIEEVEGKINKLEDTGTGVTYTLGIENGIVFLDDGKE